MPVGAATLYLGGVDDPRFLRSPASYAQLRNSVEQAVSASPSDAFTVLLSHRSQALDYAAPLGSTDLILAGHTHGFQLGMAGRSFVEPFFPERYIWGHYEKGTHSALHYGRRWALAALPLRLPARGPNHHPTPSVGAILVVALVPNSTRNVKNAS